MPSLSRLAAGAVLSLAPGSALAANDSAFTDLDVKRCAVIHVATTDEAGNTLPKRDHYADEWRCPGHGGLNVFVAYGDSREGIAFGTGPKPAGDYMWHPKFGSWGPRVEWRGPARGGAVEPFAAVVRYRWSVDGRSGSDLAVFKLSRDGRACRIAWVPAANNPTANTTATRTANDRAPEFDCAKDEPFEVR
jgi:hypothetical protein